jgi:hypothetical protein
MSSDAITADNLREHVDHWVVKKRGHGTQIVHMPAPDSTPDAPRPVCEDRELASGRLREWAGWQVKSPAVYPSGYVSLCENCSTIIKRDAHLDRS